jgi:S1-C subfamily serine protease
VVSDQRHVLTAAHCLHGRDDIHIELHDGRRVRAAVERLDKDKDFALLKLSDDAEVTPLRFASELPDPGDALYFGGRADRHGSNQIFAVVRIGRCPSLPQVDNAIFTNLRARKGDSGAPLVNRNLEVVGLVHGGERCNIAAPTIGLDAELGLDSGAEPSACVWGHC